ncbi:MAG TPA: flagellar biosynthetic protein FliR [Anaerolineaceae bacterium]
MLISFAQFQLFFMALTRILSIVIHIPVLAGPAVPTQVRIALGIILTLIMVPWQPVSSATEALPLITFAVGIFKELVIGTLAGFAIDLTFGAVQITGELVGLTGGFTASRILNPALGESTSVIDQLYTMVALLIFLALNGHHTFLAALNLSFQVIPTNGPLPATDLASFTQMTSRLIMIGIQMALPVMGALLLTDLTLGLLARVAPQIQVFFLGLPLKVGISLLGTSLALSIIIPVIVDLYKQMGFRFLGLLGG